MKRRTPAHLESFTSISGPVGPAIGITLALVLLVSILPVVRAEAAPPARPAGLTSTVDLVDDYEGQVVCDPTPKPGTVALRDLLRRTYGSNIWTSISRDCNVTWDLGTSEHKDGRAIDWGVSIRNSTKAMGDEFFAWATANNGEMARRLGIMYLIWDSRMWRSYDMARGFTEYRSCQTAWAAPSYDTTCHRDHMHISLTWHGASGATSWYDGSAVTAGKCPAGAAVAVSGGSRNKPSVVFDPINGVGTKTGCHLGNRIQTVKLQGVGGDGAIQSIRVSQLRLNAPGQFKVWTNAGAGFTLNRSSATPYERDVNVGADGLIYFQVSVGQATVRVEGVGQTSSKQLGAFVNQVYEDVLGRKADAAGLASWTGRLRSGALDRGTVVKRIILSQEGSSRAATTMYSQVLGRAPDPAGLAVWASRISAGTIGLKDSRTRFWGSAERQAQSGSVERWVGDLYRAELGRPAEPGGLANWSQVVRTQGHLAAARGVLGSAEWSQLQVAGLYRSMLGREPDPGGLANWTARLMRTDLISVQIGIGESSEYFNRA